MSIIEEIGLFMLNILHSPRDTGKWIVVLNNFCIFGVSHQHHMRKRVDYCWENGAFFWLISWVCGMFFNYSMHKMKFYSVNYFYSEWERETGTWDKQTSRKRWRKMNISHTITFRIEFGHSWNENEKVLCYMKTMWEWGKIPWS